MSRIRQHVRGSRRLATAGVAVSSATLLAVTLSPAAHAAPRPSRAAAVQHAAAALRAHASSLGLDSAQATSVRDVIVDKDGSQHVRYDRTYHRLPVLGGDFVVHIGPDGGYRGADRASRAALALPSTTPEVSAPEAADLATNALRAANLGNRLGR